VSDAVIDEGLFEPDAFVARARRRMTRPPPTAAGDHLLNPDAPRPDTYRDAAVLIPLVAHTPAATLLLTRRTSHLTAHASQIAFPGGKIDPTDSGAAAAALRETEEEIGLASADVVLVGELAPYLTNTGYRVTPVLGRIEPGHRFALNRAEVAEMFEVPLAFLMDPANHHRASRAFNGKTRYFYEITFEGRTIWGATAGIIRQLYDRMFD
jgi:8-oxo-dGTP pyrophosphatase MutT (NUDIX family)